MATEAKVLVSIYKPCDIRGLADAELSAAMYEAWGRELGRQLAPGAKFVVGGDVRDSTPPFLAALTEGLCRSGLDVVELGLLPTPMIYHAKRRLEADGCAIVTASHNPAAVNGLKWMLRDRPPTPDEVADMQRALSPVEHSSGQGRGEDRTRTTPRTLDVSFDYVAYLQETFVDSLAAQLHVVLDPMHGCWAEKARRYLHAIFPQCIFSTIRDQTDGRFGGLAPDCSRPENLHELCDAVYHQRAHLGVAFDGDGDRLALVDDEGVVFSSEEAAFTLLECLGEELRGEPFVHDLKYSDQIAEFAQRVGAEPLAERSGHAFLRARMCETNARFGAEASGHYFFRELAGGDDSLYTACRLIAWLAHSGRTLSEVRRGCPAVQMTPDLRVPVDQDERQEIIEQVGAAWDGFPQIKTDGVRIDTPGGWALVRSSVTEPVLTFRFEGLDWHALDDLVKRIRGTLPEEVGNELWRRYRAAMGTNEK